MFGTIAWVMKARLARRDPRRRGCDAEGRRVFVGSADVRVDDAELWVGLWCLGTDAQLLWWIGASDVPSGDMLLFSPDRQELLVGSAEAFIRVQATTGSILDRGLKTELRDFAWAHDGTLVGMDGQRLVRRTLDGQPRPTWAKRGGLSGLVDGLVEPWLSRSDSVPAMMLGGRTAGLAFAADRAIRFGNAATAIAGPNRELHLVSVGAVSFGKGDERSAVSWVRFDERGAVLHRLVIPAKSPANEAVVDAAGRLWVRVSQGKGHAIMRVDPEADNAQLVVRSQRANRIAGFTVDLDGQLQLPTDKKLDSPTGDAANVPIVRRRGRLRPVAIAGLLVLAAVNAAVAPIVLAGRAAVLRQAATGVPLRVSAGKGGHKTLQPEDLLALAPGQLAYAVELVVLAVGLVVLATTARSTPARAISLGWAWVTVVAVAAVVINGVVTLRPMGGFDTFTLAGFPGGALLGTWIVLLFGSALGHRIGR